MKLSLKKKTILLIVSIVILVSLASVLICSRAIMDIVRIEYSERAVDVCETAAISIDPDRVRRLRMSVGAIYDALDESERVSSDAWGTPELEAYYRHFALIEDTPDYQILRQQIREIQDVNHVQCIYVLYIDVPTERLIYLADGQYEDYCRPGCFDEMYEENRATLEDPTLGIPTAVSDTEQYGMVIGTGVPIYDRVGTVVGYVCADLSLREIIREQTRMILFMAMALLLLTLLACYVSIKLVNHFVIKPINTLSDASAQYSSTSGEQHRFDNLGIRTGDEIETLARSMSLMERDINTHINDLLELTKELITTREQAEKMDRIANIDALTKVRNKRAYDQEIARLNQEIRNGKTDVGLIMIDLNLLKRLNDTYGHEKGNIAIITLCQLVCEIFKHSPVFRVGGDEFVVVLENTDYRNVRELLRRFEGQVEELATNYDRKPWERVSAAAGFAVFDPARDSCMEDVFKRADQEMYRRKQEMKAGAY